jgi:hypothetical protein
MKYAELKKQEQFMNKTPFLVRALKAFIREARILFAPKLSVDEIDYYNTMPLPEDLDALRVLRARPLN